MQEYTRKARDLRHQSSTSPKEWENVHEQKPLRRAKSQECAMRWETRGASVLSRRNKEKPNLANVTKDSYYVILAPKHHSLTTSESSLLTWTTQMRKEELRMFEESAAAYEVEGGNLEKSVVLAQRGLTVGCNRLMTGNRAAAFWLLALWLEGLTEAWDREEAPMTRRNTNVCLAWVPPEPYFGKHWLTGHNYREYLGNKKQAKFK